MILSGPGRVFARPIDPRDNVPGHPPNTWAEVGRITRLEMEVDDQREEQQDDGDDSRQQ